LDELLRDGEAAKTAAIGASIAIDSTMIAGVSETATVLLLDVRFQAHQALFPKSLIFGEPRVDCM
jgi:hypothetical protein